MTTPLTTNIKKSMFVNFVGLTLCIPCLSEASSAGSLQRLAPSDSFLSTHLNVLVEDGCGLHQGILQYLEQQIYRGRRGRGGGRFKLHCKKGQKSTREPPNNTWSPAFCLLKLLRSSFVD